MNEQSERNTDRRPVIMVVDDDTTILDALRAEVDRRYGADYRVLAESSAEAALECLAALRDGRADVALLIADHWMPEMLGTELLTRALDLCPRARRALLIDRGDQSTGPAVQRSMTLGRIHYFLTKPWRPADDLLHPLITGLLSEWTRENRPTFEMATIVGDQWQARCHELRDLFDRNAIPYGFYDKDSAKGRAVLEEAGAASAALPVVIYRGQVLARPTNVDLAQAVGVKTTAPPDAFDVAIVGAGPAGLAAAVYAASEGLGTVVIEAESIGGQASTSSLIRNYLGFPRGLSGAELAERAYRQAWLFGADFVFMQPAMGLRAPGDRRFITLADGSEVVARAVVLATGVSYRRLGLPGIDELLGSGVFYGAARAEAKAMEGQKVYTVGAGNSAGQAALHLARYAARVTMLVRGNSLESTMSDYLVRDIERAENIDVRLHNEVVEGRGRHRLEGLRLRDRRSGETEDVDATALFILIGAVPKTEWLEGAVRRDERGYVLTGRELDDDPGAESAARTPALLETSVPGVFAVGDVRSGSVKRVASAVGEGAMVIALVHEYLGNA